MISVVWVFVAFLSWVFFGSILVTSAWKNSTDSVQDLSPV